MKINWIVGVPLLLALGVVALGCGSSGSLREPLESGLLSRSPETAEDEMDAIIGGTLEIDPERGCILLSGRPVIWPAGTKLTIDPPEVNLPGGLTARAGDAISGRGGEVPASKIRETSIRIEGDVTHALECVPIDIQVAVFSARGDNISVSPGG
jgi:hypothetical protein